jgi:hypothetical protein
LAKKVLKRFDRSAKGNNELSHSIQRVHCILKSWTDVMAMDDIGKQVMGSSFGKRGNLRWGQFKGRPFADAGGVPNYSTGLI